MPPPRPHRADSRIENQTHVVLYFVRSILSASGSVDASRVSTTPRPSVCSAHKVGTRSAGATATAAAHSNRTPRRPPMFGICFEVPCADASRVRGMPKLPPAACNSDLRVIISSSFTSLNANSVSPAPHHQVLAPVQHVGRRPVLTIWPVRKCHRTRPRRDRTQQISHGSPVNSSLPAVVQHTGNGCRNRRSIFMLPTRLPVL